MRTRRRERMRTRAGRVIPMADHLTLPTARTVPDIIEAAARFEWWERNGAESPASAIPSDLDLVEAIKADRPGIAEAQAEAAERAAALGLIGPGGPPGTRDIPVEAWRWADTYRDLFELMREVTGGGNPDAIWTLLHQLRKMGSGIETRLALAVLDEGGAGVSLLLADVHSHWRALPEANRPQHPLVPLVAAWQDTQPHGVEPERRRDRRILPRIVAGVPSPERQAGMLFGGLHDGRRTAAPELPLWPEVTPAKRVPLLDLVDAAGLPVMARGRGAPLPLRLFVRTLASVRPENRRLVTARLALTVRELRDGLWPNGWRIGQHWPELRDALMHARDYAIHDGAGRWFPVALRRIPDAPQLDDLIVLDIAFPPGSHSGPPVALPDMDRLSVESAPRWRAYIAAQSVAWLPGKTLVPVPRTSRFVWTRNLAAYPVLTLPDRQRFAFGLGDRKHRTRAEIDAAFRDLPGLVVVSESAVNERTGDAGWIVIPEAAALAVRGEKR